MSGRSPLLISLLLALTVTLAACGDDEPDPVATPEPSPTATAVVVPSPTAEPADEELSTAEVVRILTQSVVQVVTEVLSIGVFGQQMPGSGVGTGVILDEQGHILTNNHVVAGAQRIIVTLSNGDTHQAQIVGSDLNPDLAVIRIAAAGLVPAKLGVSSELEVGQDVIAIGHALGLSGGPTVSKGVISALGRTIETDQQITIVDLIQTDASINPGNSGGPLVNTSAEVIGINTTIIQGGQGLGFSINIDDAKIVVAQLIEKGEVQRGFLGIVPFNLTPGLATRFNLSVTEGVIIANVIPDTAAAAAGLQMEDVIVKLDDQTIRNTGDLSKFLIDHLTDSTIALTYVRGDQETTIEITLGDRPDS